MLLVAVLLLLLGLRAPSEGPDGFDDDDEYLLGRCCRMQSIIGLEIASRTGRWTAGGASAIRRRVNMVQY